MTAYVDDRWFLGRCHLWADTEDEMQTMALIAGVPSSAFVPSNPPKEPHRLFRHFLATPEQAACAVMAGAVQTDEWGVTRWVALRTMSDATVPHLHGWAANLLATIERVRQFEAAKS